MSLLLRGASSVRMTPAVGMVPIPLLARQHTRPFRSRNRLAVLIPGDSVLESTTIGGTATFFGIYQNVIVPPIFGLDLSPVLALFLLQALGSATTALGSELPGGSHPPSALRRSRCIFPWIRRKETKSNDPTNHLQ